MKVLWQYLIPYKKQLVIGPFFKLCEAVLELLIPTLMAYIIDKGIRAGDIDYIFRTGLLMLAIAVIGLLCAYVCQYSASIASQGVGTRVRNAVFQHISKLSYAQVERYGTSALVTRITNDINLMQQGVAMVIRLFIRAPFICVGSIIMALFIDAKLALIFIAAMPVFVILTVLIMRATIPLYKTVQQWTEKIAAVLRENLAGVRVIRAFAKQKEEKRRFEDANRDYERFVVKVGRLSAVMNPASMLLMNLVVAAVLYFGAGRVNTGSMTQGEITAFISYASYMLTALVVLANLIVLLTKAAASSLRIAELLRMEPDIVDKAQDCPGAENDVAIAFENVSFAYNAGSEEAVSNINFAVKQGEQIGIIGGTGAGKSTVVNLIGRFYEPTCGQILIYGVDVRAFPQKALRAKIGMVFQKAVLLSGTVADNIRQGKPDAADEEIAEALKAAQAFDFIMAKPEGINARVNRGGTNFSGGQKQRLSIARALVRKPEILILDDSSSALDYATDAALRGAIRDYAGDMTVITVSQRVSTLLHCDKILVLADGVQMGYDTHENLLQNCPVYADICASQLQKEGTV